MNLFCRIVCGEKRANLTRFSATVPIQTETGDIDGTVSIKRDLISKNKNEGISNRLTYHFFLAGGASSNACSETYAGSSAFSEIETKSLSQYLESISDKFFAYISFHSYSQLLLFPYGHTKDHLENYNDLVRELFLFSISSAIKKKDYHPAIG